jgi:large repetitive protein
MKANALRRRTSAALVASVALLGTTGAAGAPGDAYTAVGTPAVVKPATQTVFTVQLTNDPGSPSRAQRARIGIPPGFSVSTLSATTSAAGACLASTWAPGAIVDGVVEFKKPGGGNTTELCPGGTLTISIDASAPSEGIWTWTTELLRDTAFELQEAQPAVRVDGTPPVLSIDESPGNPSNDSSASFSFFADEPGVSFECKLDEGTFAPCVSSKSYGQLLDGGHAFQLRGTDSAGNAGATVTYAWTIATFAPLTAIESAPPAYSNSGSAVFTFSTSAEGATFECRLNEGAFATCSSPQSYAGLADGEHSFEVYAKDTAGNQGSPTGYGWTVDTVAPNATIDTKPPSLGRSTSATLTFSADEAATTFECKLDGGAFTTCLSPTAYGPLAEGTHMFSLRATDRAGNVGAATTYSWTVDTTPPNTAITAGPAPAAASTSASLSFTATESGSSFECKLDTLAWTACVSPQLLDALAQGQHSFAVRATDAAGNLDPTPDTRSWTVDTVPPETTIVGKPATPTNNSTAAFTFSASEAGTFQCKLDLEPDFTECGATATFTSVNDGEHVVTVRARDAAGNVDPSPASYTWAVDTAPPDTFIVAAPPDPSPSGAASFTVTSDDPAATFDCRIDAGAFAACTSPVSYLLGDGQHTFQVRARDAANNVDPTPASRTWQTDTREPDTTISTKPAAAVNSSSATFGFDSSDSGVTFECSLDSSPFSACTSPKIYSGLQDGSHTFEVRARDKSGNADLTPASHTWIVDTTPPETLIDTAPANQSASGAASFAFTSNESGATFECKLDTGSFATCTSPTSYSLTDGRHTFEVRARDAASNVDASPASHSWTVDSAPPDTVIVTAPAEQSASAVPTFTFTSNESGGTFECKLDTGSFATCTSPSSYALPDGQHTFVVRAIDRAGNVDATPAAHTWTIDSSAPAPTIAQPVDGSSTNDTTPAFSGSAGTAATDSPTITVRIHSGSNVGGPVLQTFSVIRTGGTWAGAAGPLAEGVYTARAEQTDAAMNTGYSEPTTFNVDTGGPGTTITDRPTNPTVSATATFRFTSNDATATFTCRLDAGEFATCASPVAYEGLAPGIHIFSVKATDRAGNAGGNATYSWTVVAPTSPPPPPEPAPPPPAPAAQPPPPDVVPPQDVTNLRVKPGIGAITLTWAPPVDADFDRVSVTRTAAGKNARASQVYQGGARTLTDRRVTNGVRYRYRITTHDRAGNASAGVEVAAAPLSPLVAPRKGASVSAPPVLRWRAAPRATYYNVQLWLVRASGQQQAARPGKVLSVWPSVPRLKLTGRWVFEGKNYRLVPGSYRWYVFPGFGKRSQARYGALLGQSAFAVRGKKAL